MASIQNEIIVDSGNAKTISLSLNLEINIQTNSKDQQKNSIPIGAENENETNNLVEDLKSPINDIEDLPIDYLSDCSDDYKELYERDDMHYSS